MIRLAPFACGVVVAAALANSPATHVLAAEPPPTAARPGSAPASFAAPLRFDFGTGPAADGWRKVAPTMRYTKERSFGFDPGTAIEGVDRSNSSGGPADPVRADYCTAAAPFQFSVDLPEGNYDVTVTLGDAKGTSATTVKAESRRLMLENVQTGAGQFERRTFTVNVRRPEFGGPDGSAKHVKLKAREKTYLHWDDRLTLEFAGPKPCVCGLEIAPAPSAVTVYIAGDSTVTDQPNEPYNSWGQMLPRFFKPGVAVANHAESGESLRSSLGAGRFDKIWSAIRPGDYLLVQFGHNDQKDKTPGAGAQTTYAAFLEQVVAEARRRGATPVLVTPVSRRSFGDSGKAATIVSNLGEFPDAVRRVAAEQKVPLVDLNAMSRTFYEAMGPEKSKAAFAPGDNTHHDNYGSYELAKCVVEGLRTAVPDLAAKLADDVPRFDPTHPDAVEAFAVPASATRPTAKPDGN